jgi:DNA invertase Pin-like site-specific DNA recombinase
VLLSFAQFERQVTGERIRDKIAASKKKGLWMGGVVPLGYRVEDRALQIVEGHAEIVRSLFRRYLGAGSVVRLKQRFSSRRRSSRRPLKAICRSALASSVSSICRWPGQISGARSDSRRQRRRNEESSRTRCLPGTS